MKLAQLGEFGLIGRLRQLVGTDPAGTLGIGDDCAAWSIPAGQELLVTSDLLLEGTHFRRDWTDLQSLGRKAVAVNLSDIAAMGGTARQLVLGLGLPGELEVEEVEGLMRGFLQSASDYGVHLVGGDTVRAQQFLTIAVTAFGTVAAGQAIRRDGARSGELLFVSGSLGESALALRSLQAGESVPAALRQRHFEPTPQLQLGAALAERRLATAMLDISDGLLADLDHLLGNRVGGARLNPAAIPLSPALHQFAQGPEDALQLALNGGEDYELLFTAAASEREAVRALAVELGVAVSEIGVMDDGCEGIWLEGSDGHRERVVPGGFQHFTNDING